MTIWRPDTCKCKIEYDSSFVVAKIYNKCLRHDSLVGQTLLDAIILENQTENMKAVSEITKSLNKKSLKDLS